MFGIQIPTASGEASQQKVRPEWSIVLAYEQKLRKEAMKKVLEGHTLSESLLAVIRDPDLKEAYFTTPVALRSALSEPQQPNKWPRFNSKGGFSGKQSSSFTKGKGNIPRANQRANPLTSD